MGFYPSEGDVDSNGAEEVNLRTAAGVELLGQQVSAASLPVVIASNNIVTVAPSVTSNGFSASMTKTAIGTTELNALFLKNPNASGKTLVIRSLTFGNIHTVNGSWVRLRVYSNPTTSANGSAVTAAALAVGSGATAVATPFNTPTSSATGQLLYDATVYSGNSMVFSSDNNLTIAANNTVMVTVVADAAGRSSNMTLIWNEV